MPESSIDNKRLPKGVLPLLVLVVTGFLITVMAAAGFAASTGDLLYPVALMVALVGVAFVVDYRLLMLITLVGGLVISGLTQLYIPKIELIRWAFFATSCLLFGHIALEAIKNNKRRIYIDSAVIFWSLMFVFVLISSSISQGVSGNTIAIGMKGYIQVWGVLFGLAYLSWDKRLIHHIPTFILAVSLIQIPFVLHQYFVLVPIRARISDVAGLVPIDVVSGTFGGKLKHGGANAALTLLCFITTAGLTALWKNKQLTTPYFITLAFLAIFPSFLNSTKISVFYMFIILFVVYANEIVAHPLKFLAKLGAALALCLVMAMSILSTMPEGSDVTSLSELYEYTYSYNVEESNIRDNNLSRSGAIKAWFETVQPHNIKDVILGYGIGASRFLETEGGQRISKMISLERNTNATAISSLLWETGIVGLLSVLILFLSAFIVATRLKRHYRDDAFLSSMFTAIQCAVLILFVSLGHKSFFIYHIGFQTLYVTILGYLAYWERQMNQTLEQNV